MANNEEKIYLLKVGEEEPCSRCKWESAFSRAEVVGEMVNAFIKYDRDRDKSKPLDPYKAMEAALDALLGKESENGK